MNENQREALTVLKRWDAGSREQTDVSFSSSLWSEGFHEYLHRNLIYCEQTHSFVHRLYDKFKEKMPEDHRDAQHLAWQVITEMENTFMLKDDEQ